MVQTDTSRLISLRNNAQVIFEALSNCKALNINFKKHININERQDKRDLLFNLNHPRKSQNLEKKISWCFIFQLYLYRYSKIFEQSWSF